MHPLNPFLRAFFRSTLPAQCVPASSHILLVPTTDVLFTYRDRESNAPYSELASSEDFLSSHVLRLPPNNNAEGAKDGSNAKDGKGKAKQFSTINGKTVVIKDAYVYSSKGFKSLAQAQLLNDLLWYNDRLDPQQWLVYFISRPLLGSPELVAIAPATLPMRKQLPATQTAAKDSGRKEIKSFNDLLNAFPMIARQMQPELERLFKEFARTLDKELPLPPLESETEGSSHIGAELISSSAITLPNGHQNGHIKAMAKMDNENPESSLRQALEAIITAAIDLFQLVDKQQLSLLGATTDLTGPLVERLIEKYVTEQVHDSMLFPRLCDLTRQEDLKLESKIRQMEDLDISQVGILISGGRQGKQDLLLRLQKGIEEFRKLGVAGSPQEMAEIILTTERTIAMIYADKSNGPEQNGDDVQVTESEKLSSVLTVNADTLVSLLLVVIIRSQIRHLHARLMYMRRFIFIDDVDSGELGYALSTFEAVLSYLAKDSGNLRKASRRNKILWEAAKSGQVETLKAIFEPSEMNDSDSGTELDLIAKDESISIAVTKRNGLTAASSDKSTDSTDLTKEPAHVTPRAVRSASTDTVSFQVDEDPTISSKKRVSMDVRSISSSSGHSYHSRATTVDSTTSGLEGDISLEKLSQTQDPAGDSVLMMAVECRQPHVLRYLLGLHGYFPLETVLEDGNNDATTILSSAVQGGNPEVINIILDFIMQEKDHNIITTYLRRQDSRGRTMAHYLFNAHYLIQKLGPLLPWDTRDKNGQTPLFALCRSYDHPCYREMVATAMEVVRRAWVIEPELCLDDHIDSKGNTLLHIVNNIQLAQHILSECNSDVNATNDKKFTPLMVASKYGRIDMVRTLFADPRVDLSAKELRGLTAVELAKDDEVRSRIDDLTLLANPPDEEGRITAVVRSYLVEDGSIRLVVKSATSSSKTTITVTTCRRSFFDFENLAKCLMLEHPASWLPSIMDARSAFQIPSKPSRAVLRDIQLRLDAFLKILLAHPTFSTHEMLWEFFLVPEILPEMMMERSHKKAAARAERVRDEYAPGLDAREVETFIGHAKEAIRGVNHATKSVIRRMNKIRTLEAGKNTILEPCHR